MADSQEHVARQLEQLETRQAKLEGAFVQIAALLTEQSERVDAGFRQLWSRMDGLNERVDGLNERVDGLNERMNGLNERVDGLNERMDGVNQRLDRLIAVTLQERTAGAERLSKIEARLDKLEERSGG